MKHTKQQIAEFFSNGHFPQTTEYLSDEVVWDIIGENTFKGKKEVTENCKQTSEYFKTVQTIFTTDRIISLENQVVVIGTAEFKRDGKRLNFISACDVYDFNDQNMIEKIASYCIPDKI
ncbi:nuclear transport factor 2 family protein [Aquimarina sp. M1]